MAMNYFGHGPDWLGWMLLAYGSPCWVPLGSRSKIQAMDRVPMGGDVHYFLCMTCCMTSLATHRRPLLHWEPKQALTWQVTSQAMLLGNLVSAQAVTAVLLVLFWSCAVRFVPQFNTSMCWVYLLIFALRHIIWAKLQCMVLYQIISHIIWSTYHIACWMAKKT